MKYINFVKRNQIFNQKTNNFANICIQIYASIFEKYKYQTESAVSVSGIGNSECRAYTARKCVCCIFFTPFSL